MKTNLFVENIELYKKRTEISYLDDTEIKVDVITNGIILPLKVIDNKSTDGIFAGGVCDENCNFISGIRRHKVKAGNFSCISSYKIKKESIKKMDDEIIYGGVLIEHFGHSFLECLSRLWYIVKNKNDKRKIAFLLTGDIKKYHYDMLKLLNIKKDRIVIITEPIQFKKVIVPEETIHSWDCYKKEYNLVYDEIRKNVKSKKYDKLYLTRTKLDPNYDVNEKYFEIFFENRGYKVLSPETLSFKEQIEYISGAKEIVTTLGTLSHFGLCMDYGSKLIILNRTKTNNLIPQYIINEARRLNVTYIDAMLEVLPIEHAGGCVCLYPTEYFMEYLNKEEISYSNNEIEIDKDKVILEYLKKWSKNYTNPIHYSTIEKYDIYDVIKSLNKELNNISISKEDIFPKGSYYHLKKFWIKKNDEHNDEIKKLKQEIEELKKKNKLLKNKYDKVINSKSWKFISKIRRIIKRK